MKMPLLRRLLTGLAVVFVVLAAAVFMLLPPRTIESQPPGFTRSWPVVKGAYHIHSARSDGTGSIDEIAADAARAGLQFIILADHGDGTRPPEPPSYRSGVLCIDGVEVSTTYGHYVALDMPQVPFRLAGRPRDVIGDVHRFGGFGIAAHPSSTKAALQWDDWDAPFDGLEWLNADTEWRDELWTALGRVLLTYGFRPTETLASLLDRPDDVLAQWDRLAQQRHVIGLAGADAHARLGLRQSGEPYDDEVHVRLPSYEASFRAFANHVILDAPLTGEAAADTAFVLDAIRKGRTFTTIEGLARLGAFEVKALSTSYVARPGESIDVTTPVEIDADLTAPAGTTLVVLRNGESIYDSASSKLRIEIGSEPGAYRIEARLPASMQTASIPWLVTNPIYVNLGAAHKAYAAAQRGAPPADTERTGIATEAWRAESSAGSESALSAGRLEDGTPVLQWRLKLAEGPPVSQHAAIWFPADRGLAAHARLQLRARADRPMRLWAQLRAPRHRGEQRWAASFYVGPELETVDVALAEFYPLTPVDSEKPVFNQVDSLLLVADTLHTLPGTAATISIVDLWLVK